MFEEKNRDAYVPTEFFMVKFYNELLTELFFLISSLLQYYN
jgi:hypothetical protein